MIKKYKKAVFVLLSLILVFSMSLTLGMRHTQLSRAAGDEPEIFTTSPDALYNLVGTQHLLKLNKTTATSITFAENITTRWQDSGSIHY